MPTKAFVYVLSEKPRGGSVQSELEKKLFPNNGMLGKLAPQSLDEAYGPLARFRAAERALEKLLGVVPGRI